MKAAILTGETDSELKLVIELAKKLELSTRSLSKTDMEEIAMLNAIKAGETGKHINTKSFINSLR
jgi:hypothetical protein